MKVKELIKYLSKLDQNLPVIATDGQGMSYEFIGVPEAANKGEEHDQGSLARFKNGYKFCDLHVDFE